MHKDALAMAEVKKSFKTIESRSAEDEKVINSYVSLNEELVTRISRGSKDSNSQSQKLYGEI